ncbi:MAG TPA: hypothetical protein DCX28_16945 [Enterobacteriaceae bacterium]|nr:hypothetical protein [Enterobacteriaceae bacterium]
MTLSLVSVKRQTAAGCLLETIVVRASGALNAHSCRCLAHFSRPLEKTHKSAHTGRNKKREWSGMK